MHEEYSIVLCVSVSVNALVAIYLVYMSKVRQYTVVGFLKIRIMWTFAEEVLFIREIWRLPATMISNSTLNKKHTNVLDTIANGMV